MKDKKEIPKYHGAGNIKYYYAKINNKNYKENSSKLRQVTEVSSFSDIHLINFNEASYENNIRNIF